MGSKNHHRDEAYQLATPADHRRYYDDWGQQLRRILSKLRVTPILNALRHYSAASAYRARPYR